MTTEEKAQRYDEISKDVKDFFDGKQKMYSDVEQTLNYLFPELGESEDERIRKAIIDFLWKEKIFLQEAHSSVENNPKYRFVMDAIAWLEKQGNHLENYDEAEKEKVDFVGDGFIECRADFLDFKEGNSYWLEYVGDDKYNVRSDNLLGKTYHITPCQLYTVFKKLTWLEKQGKVDKESYDIAEKEKYDFVSGKFIQCRKSFYEFKEYNSYWFEYIGNDTYIGKSDNILNKKFHITPRQLYCLFTQQRFYPNPPTAYGKYGEQKKQVHFPKFTFDDVLALQCCMEIVKKVQEDKDLYEKLNGLHGRVYDAYQLEKQGEQREQLINKACDVLVNCIEDFMSRRMEVWNEECKKQTLENIRKTLEE